MYSGYFEEKSDIAREYQIDVSELENCRILFAVYTTEDYTGSAYVLYEKEGKLYEVHGSHCSCYGLEGQWQPEETFFEVIRMRDLSYYGFNKTMEEILVDLIFEKDVLEN